MNTQHTNVSNVVFKVGLIVFLVLVVTFYFKINLFKFSFFKKTKDNKKGEFKPLDVNRKLSNAVLNANYASNKLPDFQIKSAFSCAKAGNDSASVERLKIIISQGFRCLDFELQYKDNNIFIKKQVRGESFLDALQIIDQRAFSNIYCSNNADPIITTCVRQIKRNNGL